jgi:chaperone BCS1
VPHLVEIVRKQLENQFLTGGMVLVIFTALLAMLRNAPRQLWAWVKRRFITTIDISDHDPAFFWIQKWLGEQTYTRDKARLLTASTRMMPVNQQNKAPDVVGGYIFNRKRQLTEVVFSPAPGRHLIRFQGHFILLTRDRRTGEGILGELAYHESFIFQTFSRQVVHDLIFEARETAFPPEDNRIAILRPSYMNWRVMQRRLPRDLDSVILEGDTTAELLKDLAWFFRAASWYADHGIPYQRGYLLYGPPGNGKTSIVVALASAFDRDIYILSLTGLSDSILIALMGELPEHALVLIEDIDRAFHARERTKDTNEQLTFSGFLNAIDGVSAPPGRVLFMTTNHTDLLDEAIVRPGRADRHFEFKNASPNMAYRLFLRFFPEQEHLATSFEKQVAVGTRTYSMADLQEHLIKHREDAEAAAMLIPYGKLEVVQPV